MSAEVDVRFRSSAGYAGRHTAEAEGAGSRLLRNRELSLSDVDHSLPLHRLGVFQYAIGNGPVTLTCRFRRERDPRNRRGRGPRTIARYGHRNRGRTTCRGKRCCWCVYRRLTPCVGGSGDACRRRTAAAQRDSSGSGQNEQQSRSRVHVPAHAKTATILVIRAVFGYVLAWYTGVLQRNTI